MKKQRAIHRLRAIAVAPLLALVLMACGSATTGSGGAGPASAQPTAAVATAAPAASQPTAVTGADATGPANQQSVPVAARLNLNEVTENQLLSTIPDFSNRMVREFFEYRPYISIQQFRKEIGKYVSAEQVAAYEQYVYVPINVDESDAVTLRQLPGVDESTAAALIAGRPYGSNQAFLAKLATYVSDAEAQQGSAYLVAQ
jgi:DNA uptake protein ComE-like DNA-binding protein